MGFLSFCVGLLFLAPVWGRAPDDWVWSNGGYYRSPKHQHIHIRVFPKSGPKAAALADRNGQAFYGHAAYDTGHKGAKGAKGYDPHYGKTSAGDVFTNGVKNLDRKLQNAYNEWKKDIGTGKVINPLATGAFLAEESYDNYYDGIDAYEDDLQEESELELEGLLFILFHVFRKFLYRS